jgi:hypothetical protein
MLRVFEKLRISLTQFVRRRRLHRAHEAIVRLRYVSINGQLRRMLLVVKMRGSEHSIDMTEYTVTGKGVIIGAPLRGYQGLTSGIPGPWSPVSVESVPDPRQDGLPKVPPESKEGPHD